MNYYRRYVGDYLRDTSRLSMLEHGAYTLMLDYYYAEARPLPANIEDIFRMVRARGSNEEKAVRQVLAKFFEVQEDGHHNLRADAELGIALHVIDVARSNGKLGGRPAKAHPETELNGKPKNNPVGLQVGSKMAIKNNPVGFENITQKKPSTNHQPPTKEIQKHCPPSGSDVFVEFWEHWPRSQRKGSRKECLAVWVRNKLDLHAPEILAHVDAMKSSKQWQDQTLIPAPLVYLNQSRWDGAEMPVADTTERIAV